MQYYNVKIRLAGNTMNEVRKEVSSPELLILQYIHGADSIIDINRSRKGKVVNRDEKQRLKATYDQSLVKREQSIDSIFGALGTLPLDLPEDMQQIMGIVDSDDLIAVAKQVTSDAKRNTGVPKTIQEANNLDKIVSQDEINLDDIME